MRKNIFSPPLLVGKMQVICFYVNLTVADSTSDGTKTKLIRLTHEHLVSINNNNNSFGLHFLRNKYKIDGN